MGIITSKTFKSGNSEAVRLPKEVAFGANIDVTIEKNGDTLIIRPAKNAAAEKQRLADFIARLRAIPAPGVLEIRDTDDIPERPGL